MRHAPVLELPADRVGQADRGPLDRVTRALPAAVSTRAAPWRPAAAQLAAPDWADDLHLLALPAAARCER